jgi:hypothetical protein
MYKRNSLHDNNFINGKELVLYYSHERNKNSILSASNKTSISKTASYIKKVYLTQSHFSSLGSRSLLALQPASAASSIKKQIQDHQISMASSRCSPCQRSNVLYTRSSLKEEFREKKIRERRRSSSSYSDRRTGSTGLEPATSTVTGWCSNQLNYNPLKIFSNSK